MVAKVVSTNVRDCVLAVEASREEEPLVARVIIIEVYRVVRRR